MRKKGFTLIELLAVISVLAVIVLITVPIIMGVTKNAKEEGGQRSVDLFANALRNSITSYELDAGKQLKPGIYTPKSLPFKIKKAGTTSCNLIAIYNDGNFFLTGCSVNGEPIDYTYGIDQGVCEYEDSEDDIGSAIGEIDISDIVTCGTEKFYVMFNENNKVTMLSMYNLEVGGMYFQGNYSSLKNTSGIQSKDAIGVKSGVSKYYGVLGFSSLAYWKDSNGNLLSKYGINYPVYVYDENSTLYKHIENYEKYLKQNGLTEVEASPVTLTQANRILGLSVIPEWVYSTSYWTGIAVDEYYINYVSASGSIGSFAHAYPYEYGVRPVVNIPTTSIMDK